MSKNPSCAERRKVSGCSACVRYKECANHTMTFSNDLGATKLGLSILRSLAEDYAECWRKGYINTVLSYDRVLKSPYPTILSNGQFDGVPIMEGLKARCQQEFGSLETTNRNMKIRVNKKIVALYEKRKQATTKAKKFDITKEISKLKGELNY